MPHQYRNHQLSDVKNETRAKECRKLGNELCRSGTKDYMKAVKWYNESIALSNESSVNLALAYASRSIVCFELKMYHDCLENIRLAQLNPYPAHVLPKLMQRKERCLKIINNSETSNDSEDVPNVPVLCYEPNPKVPQVSNCLELKENDQFGRHLVTNKDLRAGDFVLMEKPFFTMLVENFRYNNCDYCLKEKNLTLIPCNHCSSTMFCSEICQQKAFESYHRIECPIIKHMQKLFTKVILMALRTTTVAISSFSYNLEDLMKHVEALEGSSLNPFDLDWTDLHAKQVYSTIHMLSTNQALRNPSDLIQRSVFSIVMSKALLTNTSLRDICGSNESYRNLIQQLIFRHAQTSPINMHPITYVNPSLGETVRFAGGAFPILSMVNHSCAPNVLRMTLSNGQTALVVDRPIKKGGQLFDDYGFHHCNKTLIERRTGLKNRYFFTCQCEACTNNYPLYYQLKSDKSLSHEKAFIDKYCIPRMCSCIALMRIPKYCKFINDFAHLYPTREISSAQEELEKCLQMIYCAQSQAQEDENNVLHITTNCLMSLTDCV
ncbi:SET and MYND domain-containing protein 4-like isoform X2 [Malaya genurostris]|uniref:SET and MYND domain-containing protein 4-like isoform X2 n=1 Tax=Malaya genurostris TaxID=325434 RepID=UPI0026F39A53|nr:SET and MYND domain-containing protein 4-like isoform X2 [Malaya genurostris]